MKVVRGVYKRDKEKEGKQFFLHLERKMVFHHWKNNFTPRENGFTLLCKPNTVKLRIEEFLG